MRHGQTECNRRRLMQARTDALLNEEGVRQAEDIRRQIGGVPFDAVYASPLKRARQTAVVVSGWKESALKIDARLLEVEVGPYELKPYYGMGFSMTLYWAAPRVFPVPEGVEAPQAMLERSASFLQDLGKEKYENVLVVTHGGILRAYRGILNGRGKLECYPRSHNCQMWVYQAEEGKYTLLKTYRPRKAQHDHP